MLPLSLTQCGPVRGVSKMLLAIIVLTLPVLKGDFWEDFLFLNIIFSAAFVCEDGWTLSEEMCLKVVGTAVSFAEASTQCANLATGGLLAAPKSEAILNTINNLNPDGEDVWVGLDDRCILLFVVG